MVGALFLAASAYLAGVYLTLETSGALQEDFRRAGMQAGWVLAALSLAALAGTYAWAPRLWDGLTQGLGAVLLAAGGVLSALALLALARRKYAWARAAAAGQVAFLLWGWAAAQWPYLTVFHAAAPFPVLRFTLALLAPGLLAVLASLWLLWAVFKR